MTKSPPQKTEYCDGLCINPESVKTDALRLMAYSNSIEPLRNRGTECSVTDANLDRNIFTEVLSLIVTLSLRCRLWNDSYRRTLDLQYVENSVVGIRRNGSKAGKKIKLREVTSFIAHANGFWFDPYTAEGTLTGTNFSISVPHDSQRANKLDSSIELILNELSKSNSDETVDPIVVESLNKLKTDAIEAVRESDRIYTINLDDFACAVCSVVDHCHSCAGQAGFVLLGADGLPDSSTMSFKNLNGWIAQLKLTSTDGDPIYQYIGAEGTTRDIALENIRTKIDNTVCSTPGDSKFEVEYIAEYSSDSMFLSWTRVKQTTPKD